MKRFFVVSVALAFALGFWGSDRPDSLIRIQRQTETDLVRFLEAGVPVVHETAESLFAEVREGDLGLLDKFGASYEELDKDPWAWDYYAVGMRPDSDADLFSREGVILYAEENWVLWRLPRGEKVDGIAEAKVFLSLLPHEVRKLPVSDLVPPRAFLRGRGPEHAVPLVQQMVNSVNTADIDAYWTAITVNSPTGNRYSQGTGCTDAANYVLSEFQNFGLQAQNITHTSGYAPNTEGQITGAINPGVIYIVEGHLDDLPSSGSAPGADDNASGSVNVLEAAKILSCYAFKNTVRFLTVTGEEQGLYGSTDYANDAFAAGANIQGVINMDMPGWAGDGLPASGENLDLNYDSNSTALATFYAQCATDYSTGLPVDAFLCPSLTASDHYGFWQNGYKAVCGITDNEGYCGHAGNYPYYHQSTDTIANCGNKTFFYNVVKTTIAALAELGEPFKITLDKSAYACSGTVQIIVGDRDLNTNTTTAQTVNVSIASTYESTPETVTLTEDGVNSMIFRGTISLAATAPVHGDGQLSVANGSTITASYTDALDCNGAMNVVYTATAPACTPPIISNVAVTDVTPTSATVTWTTNVQANSRVTYGSAVPPGTNQDDLTNFVTSHSVTLTGLTPCTPYYLSVTSTDAGGNTATDANGGAYYSFTTLGATYAMGPVDVEAGTTGWTLSGEWRRDTCKKHGGSYAFKAGSATCPGTYASSTTSDLTWTADVNLGASGHGYHLKYWEYYQTESGYDYCRPQISTNGGSTWTTLGTQYAGTGTAWALKDFDLASYSGSVRIRFEFYTDGSQVYEGWYLDDIEVSRTQACTAQVDYLSNTFSDACSGSGSTTNGAIEPGEDVTATVTLKNNGSQPATGITATLTSSTPGVAITDGTAAYTDLAAGASAAGLDTFAFQVDPTVACGTTLDFNLHIVSSQGTWDSPFTMTMALGSTTSTVASTDVPKTISDRTTITSTLTFPGAGTITDVNVTLGNITHTYDADLDITLIAPDGTRVELTSDNGAGGDNYIGTVFDDAAATSITAGTPPFTGTFRPEGSLATLNGKASNGTWTLEIYDDSNTDTGTLNAWSITIAYGSGCSVCTPASCTPPGAPNLSSATGTCSGVTLDWTAGSGTTNAFNVYRSTNASCPVGALTKVNGSPIPAGTLTYTDTTTVAGTSYTYVVKGACNVAGTIESGNSNCLAAARLATPAAPTEVSATPGCAGNSISWSNSGGATSHNVLRGTACGTALATFTNVTSPYNDAAAVAGTPYQYWVVAVNACGPGANSACVSATRPDVPGVPSAPSVADIDGCTLTGVIITWGAVAGATGYDLRVDGGSTVTGVSSPYTFSPGDAAGHTYEVRATNACGTSLFSSGTQGEDVNVGPPPVLRHYLEKMGANVLIRWTPLADPGQVDTYEVMRGLTPTGPFDVRVGTTTGIVTGLYLDLANQPAVSYYKVRAIKGSCVGSLDGE